MDNYELIRKILTFYDDAYYMYVETREQCGPNHVLTERAKGRWIAMYDLLNTLKIKHNETEN